jgi:hypothetical protein
MLISVIIFKTIMPHGISVISGLLTIKGNSMFHYLIDMIFVILYLYWLLVVK